MAEYLYQMYLYVDVIKICTCRPIRARLQRWISQMKAVFLFSLHLCLIFEQDQQDFEVWQHTFIYVHSYDVWVCLTDTVFLLD